MLITQSVNCLKEEKERGEKGKVLKSISQIQNLPRGPVVKNLPATAGDMGLIPGPGRFHMLRGS